MLHLTLDIDWQSTIFNILGGLGIFLFGINMMSEALKKIAGSRLKLFLEKSTNTPLKGILVGIFITAIIQSSSATSALVVGLVRAGLMTLPQAVGVIFGANIGTTITSVLIATNIDEYAMPMMFLGAALIFFFRNKKVKNYGSAILGFGMLFFGLETMGSALKQLSTLPQFETLLASVADHKILGVLTGAATTAVIQSSSATIGILQQLYETGGVPLVGAIAIVLGDNIGTTVTSVMASIGGSKPAKRAALIHVMFNTIGTVVFFILITPYTAFIAWLGQTIGIPLETVWGVIDGESVIITHGIDTSKYMISLAHVCFNLVNVFILYWFIKQMVWLVNKIIPTKDEIVMDDIILDENLLASPELALANVKDAIKNMGNVVKGMFEFTYNYAFTFDAKEQEMALQCEELIDTMDDKIHNYLVKIGARDLSEAQITQVAKDIDTITDLERIGDHLDNLVEFFEVRHDKKLILHEESHAELEKLFELVRKSITESIDGYLNMDKELAESVNEREVKIDKKTKKYRKNHIKRINDQSCTETAAGFYVDILSNLERIGDHCNNMAINVLSDQFSHDDQYN